MQLVISSLTAYSAFGSKWRAICFYFVIILCSEQDGVQLHDRDVSLLIINLFRRLLSYVVLCDTAYRQKKLTTIFLRKCYLPYSFTSTLFRLVLASEIYVLKPCSYDCFVQWATARRQRPTTSNLRKIWSKIGSSELHRQSRSELRHMLAKCLAVFLTLQRFNRISESPFQAHSARELFFHRAFQFFSRIILEWSHLWVILQTTSFRQRDVW